MFQPNNVDIVKFLNKLKSSSFLLCIFIFLGICILTVLSNPTYTSSKTSINVDVNVVIYPNGSMLVAQVLDGKFSNNSTLSLTIDTPRYADISNVFISDIHGSFEYVDEIDIDASLSENFGKYTLVKDELSTELIFGIGEYGSRRYAIEYNVSNVVTGYADLDGLIYDFFQYDSDYTPANVKVNVHFAYGSPLTETNTELWTHGFTGEYEFISSGLSTYTTSPLKDENSYTLMLGFAKDLIEPIEIRSTTFMSARSDVTNPDMLNLNKGLDYFYVVIISVVVLIICLILSKLSYRLYNYYMITIYTKRYGYFSEAPNGGDINITYALGKLLNICEESSIVSIGLLSLLLKGAIAPLDDHAKDNMLSLKINPYDKWKSPYRNPNLPNNPRDNRRLLTEYDEYLYHLLQDCAIDGIIMWSDLSNLNDYKEAENFLRTRTFFANIVSGKSSSNKTNKVKLNHFEASDHVIDALSNELDRTNINNIKHFISIYKRKSYRAGIKHLKADHLVRHIEKPMKIKHFTEDGKIEVAELMGFKAFLSDYSTVKHSVKFQVDTWQEILTYSLFFDLDKHIFENMLKLYKEIDTDIRSFYDFVLLSYSYGHKLGD